MTATATHQITVRHPTFDFADLPPDWVGGSRAATLYGNAGHVFIPLGEQFFIDSVKCFRDVADDDLRRAINAFIGQESVHKRAHEAIWSTLRDQGVPIDAYARCIEVLRSVEGHVPARLRLSVTAALEHYTAAFGHSFLTEDLGTAVPPEMARLLAWHGLEELEHRAVAFDLLQAVDDSYALRVGGFVFATGLLAVVPAVGVVLFARSAPVAASTTSAWHAAPGPHLRTMSRRFLRRMSVHVVDYLKPSFHPHDMDVPAEADAWVDRF